MIARYDGGVKRHKWQEDDKRRREYVEINKLQGFAATGERHKNLLSHIDRMKARLKEI